MMVKFEISAKSSKSFHRYRQADFENYDPYKKKLIDDQRADLIALINRK